MKLHMQLTNIIPIRLYRGIILFYKCIAIYVVLKSVSSDRGSGRRPSKNKEARERRVAILHTTA